MECQTLIKINPDGSKEYRPKKSYKTLDEAIQSAKIQNIKDKQITKLVGYKCKQCQKYHIGRNGKTLTKKEKNKFKKYLK